MRKIKRWAVVLAAAAAMTAVSGSAVLAEDETDAGPSSDVWLTVVKTQATNRISVTVPMAYGFAVVGTTVAEDQTGISCENGNLLLPNVRVEGPENGGEGTAEDEGYTLTYTEETKLFLKNYSTVTDENGGDTADSRSGLAVKLSAYMDYRDGDGSLLSQGGQGSEMWKMTDAQPTAAPDDYKKFRILMDKKVFHAQAAGEGNTESRFVMDEKISLEAPPDLETNGTTAAGTANVPSEKEVGITVEVGGRRGQYKQAERSVKAARIHWSIEPDYGNSGDSQ